MSAKGGAAGVTVRSFRRMAATAIPAMVLLVFVIGPFSWILVTSLKPEAEILMARPRFWPRSFTLSNYGDILLGAVSIVRSLFNSLAVALLTAGLSLFTSSLAAYALARFRFRGRNVLMIGMVLVYLFPGILVIIAVYRLMIGMGIYNTRLGLMLCHSGFCIPFLTMLLSRYFGSLPPNLEDAAMVDGAGVLGTLFRIIVPLSLPALVAAFIFSFILSWNDFLYAVMLTNSDRVMTMPVALRFFLPSELAMTWGRVTAAGVLAALPVSLLFILIQKYLVSGLTAGAVK